MSNKKREKVSELKKEIMSSNIFETLDMTFFYIKGTDYRVNISSFNANFPIRWEKKVLSRSENELSSNIYSGTILRKCGPAKKVHYTVSYEFCSFEEVFDNVNDKAKEELTYMLNLFSE